MVKTVNALVRPAVTLVFAAAFVAGFFLGKIGSDVFVGTASGVIMYFFSKRDAEKKGIV